MMRTAAIVPVCPDCGGILQSTEPEQLTTIEVAAGERSPDQPAICQCLLCGYEERPVQPATTAR
jgi:hypothetical protein